MTERLRNHPTYVLRMGFSGFVLCALMLFTLPPEMEWMRYVLAFTVLAVFLVLGIGIWSCTWLTMYEDHAISECNFIVKKKTVVPYAKIASANIVRTIMDHIFGTSNIRINVNSAVNSAQAEVSFILRKDVAERVRTIVTTGMFGTEAQDQEQMSAETVEETVREEGERVGFTYADSFLYGFLGGGTMATVWSLALIGYSVFTGVFVGEVSAFPIILFLITTGIQVVSSIIRYCNFVLTRTGDKIHIHHGLTRTYDTEFETRRINALRIRRPLFMRIIGRCTVEVEVVGINAVDNSVTPVIGLMVKEKDLDSFMERFVPELCIDIPSDSTPKAAKVPVAIKSLIYMLPIFAFFLFTHYCLTLLVPMDDLDAYLIGNAVIISGILSAITPVLCALYGFNYYRICRFGVGKSMFKVVVGAIDRETVTIQYDRVQVFSTVASPAARRHGVARATIQFLSSAGERTLTTGFFGKDELEKIQETMLERLENGEYDYRMTEI